VPPKPYKFPKFYIGNSRQISPKNSFGNPLWENLVEKICLPLSVCLKKGKFSTRGSKISPLGEFKKAFLNSTPKNVS